MSQYTSMNTIRTESFSRSSSSQSSSNSNNNNHNSRNLHRQRYCTSSSSSRGKRDHVALTHASSQYTIKQYSGLNVVNKVHERSSGAQMSRAKSFAQVVHEQTSSGSDHWSKPSTSMKTRRRKVGQKRQTTMMPIGVPRVPYKTPGENMWQWVDIWNCLYRERLIWIGQNIDEELGNQLVATMLFLDNLDKAKPMYLYINSEGGSVVPTMAIMDTMSHCRCKVGTVAFGSARAMGGLLLSNGEKGMRAALPNTCIMLHHPSGVARGAASDVQNEGKELLAIREKINKLVSKNTGQDVERVRTTINRDKHFTALQAQEWGIIDKVLYRTRK